VSELCGGGLLAGVVLLLLLTSSASCAVVARVVVCATADQGASGCVVVFGDGCAYDSDWYGSLLPTDPSASSCWRRFTACRRQSAVSLNHSYLRMSIGELLLMLTSSAILGGDRLGTLLLLLLEGGLRSLAAFSSSVRRLHFPTRCSWSSILFSSLSVVFGVEFVGIWSGSSLGWSFPNWLSSGRRRYLVFSCFRWSMVCLMWPLLRWFVSTRQERVSEWWGAWIMRACGWNEEMIAACLLWQVNLSICSHLIRTDHGSCHSYPVSLNMPAFRSCEWFLNAASRRTSCLRLGGGTAHLRRLAQRLLGNSGCKIMQ
jgi:hypothetical protein